MQCAPAVYHLPLNLHECCWSGWEEVLQEGVRMSSLTHNNWVRDPNPTKSDADAHKDDSSLQPHVTSGDYFFCSQAPESHWKPNTSLRFFNLKWVSSFALITLAKRWLWQKLTSRSSTISIIKNIVCALVTQRNCIGHTLFYIHYSSCLEASGNKRDRRSEQCFKLGKLFQNAVRNAKEL